MFLNMIIKFVIDGEFPTLNDVIALAKKHWSEYSRMKKEYTDIVAWECKARRLKKLNKKVKVKINWVCKNKRIDPDNVAFGVKFILDGLVSAKVLKNDGWNQIDEINHTFEIGKRAMVKVTLIEIEEDVK